MTPRHKESQRKQAKETTRRSLLEAAAEEFSQNGYDGANVNRIAEVAGYSIGTVYNYFPSKRALMLSFIDEIGAMHVDYVLQQVNREGDPKLRLASFFKAGFSFVQTNIREARAIFNALNGPDQEFRQRLFAAYSPLFELLNTAVIGAGVETGLFRDDLPATTSGLIMLIYLGAGSQFSPEGVHWIDHQEVADFVLHALVTRNDTKL